MDKLHKSKRGRKVCIEREKIVSERMKTECEKLRGVELPVNLTLLLQCHSDNTNKYVNICIHKDLGKKM